MQALYRALSGRLLKHPMWILYLSGGAVAFVYLLMAAGIRAQQSNPAHLKTSAEYAEAVQTINLALVRKTLAADGAAGDSDQIIDSGLAQLESAGLPAAGARDKTFEALLNDYVAGVKRLQKMPAGQLSGNDPKMRKLLDAVSPQLVREIRRASLDYQRKSEAMLGDTAMQQHGMFAVSLGSLLVIGLLLLQPLLKQLQESAMRSRQEKLLADKVIDTAQVHIFGLDTEGRVVLMNRHAEKHSGWQGDEVKGGDFAEYFMPADRRHELQTLFGGMLSGEPEASRQIEIPLLTSSGEKIPMAWNLALVEDSASGKPGMILLIGTERREHERLTRPPADNLLQFNSRTPDNAFASGDEEMIGAGRASGNIIRMSDNLYRRNERRIVQPAKEAIAFFTEEGYSGFPGHFDQDRICRILPRHNDFCNKLGWNRLLNQHNESLDDDLYALMPGKSEYRHFDLKHTDDEAPVTEAIYGWLRDEHNLPSDVIDAVLTVLDEMIENSLYSAPRDNNGLPYYPKGESRDLASYEQISVDVARGGDILGLMITDYWGTLTPSVFFKSLSRAMESGIESMESGVGLYMIWRLSDYLQIRVHPNKCTQLTVLWDVSNGFIDHNVDAGLQFLYHNDYEAPYQMRASI